MSTSSVSALVIKAWHGKLPSFEKQQQLYIRISETSGDYINDSTRVNRAHIVHLPCVNGG